MFCITTAELAARLYIASVFLYSLTVIILCYRFSFLDVRELINDERLSSEFDIYPLYYHTGETEPSQVYLNKESYKSFRLNSTGSRQLKGIIFAFIGTSCNIFMSNSVFLTYYLQLSQHLPIVTLISFDGLGNTCYVTLQECNCN
jgi:hypothetical protein